MMKKKYAIKKVLINMSALKGAVKIMRSGQNGRNPADVKTVIIEMRKGSVFQEDKIIWRKSRVHNLMSFNFIHFNFAFRILFVSRIRRTIHELF